MRVAVYARYSSDQQRQASIADQIRDCRAYATTREGWVIVQEYSARAVSGASTHRPGLQAMMRGADEYDVVLSESRSTGSVETRRTPLGSSNASRSLVSGSSPLQREKSAISRLA